MDISATLTILSSAARMLIFSKMLSNQLMKTVEEIRRERLAALVAECGGVAAAAVKLQRSSSQLSQWLNASPDSKSGKPRSISKTSARYIERIFGKMLGWMDQPIGATELACTEQSSLGVPAEFTIPLLSWVRAGDFCEAAGQFTLSDAEEMLPSPLSSTSKNTFALQVRGDSMDTPDGYREGEIVYIDPDISPTPGRDVLAKTDSGITLKRYKVDEEGPYLLQLNGNKIIRPEGPWHVCGVVVFSGRKR